MNKNGAILVIEDDEDDREVLDSIFKSLDVKNEILFFGDGEAAMDYLNDFTVQPFLILSDVNMPKVNGFELKKTIQQNHQARLRRIPFIFFTTSPAKKDVQEAYSSSVQGFFAKPVGQDHLKHIIQTIIYYWEECVSPEYIG